ncbi:uncharacterized protein LOC143296344 isoform X2 [Babylonia areolata]|uniref:uncharacterized protein LOC143296344 isoform X2 n=1 Tax=Babylonia areolata TaxID=304850 RepID=UPI003FCF8ECE
MLTRPLHTLVLWFVFKACSPFLFDFDAFHAGQSYLEECRQREELGRTCDPPLPRHYIATRKSGNLRVDGRLDDQAWSAVPWTEDFLDIRGASPPFPSPSLESRVKVVYDDSHLYVAARLTEPHVWATYTEKDSRIYQENAFEIFFDVDNSMSGYKEFEINALGTTWDLLMSRAYIDGGDFSDWEGIGEKGVYTDGAVNDIHNRSTFWSLEVSFPFTSLNENTSRSHVTPVNGEVWFINLARPEYETRPNQTTGQFEKVPGTDASWWSWNPTGAVNLHLPNKWGLLFFTSQTAQETDVSNLQMSFPAWSVYYGLFHVFEKMQTFKALRGMFVTDQNLLDLDPFIRGCLQVVDIQLTTNGQGFEVKLATKSQPEHVGHIDQNRHVWFT